MFTSLLIFINFAESIFILLSFKSFSFKIFFVVFRNFVESISSLRKFRAFLVIKVICFWLFQVFFLVHLGLYIAVRGCRSLVAFVKKIRVACLPFFIFERIFWLPVYLILQSEIFFQVLIFFSSLNLVYQNVVFVARKIRFFFLVGVAAIRIAFISILSVCIFKKIIFFSQKIFLRVKKSKYFLLVHAIFFFHLHTFSNSPNRLKYIVNLALVALVVNFFVPLQIF